MPLLTASGRNLWLFLTSAGEGGGGGGLILLKEPVEPVIFRFHRKPKRNLGLDTELPVSIYLQN